MGHPTTNSVSTGDASGYYSLLLHRIWGNWGESCVTPLPPDLPHLPETRIKTNRNVPFTSKIDLGGVVALVVGSLIVRLLIVRSLLVGSLVLTVEAG